MGLFTRKKADVTLTVEGMHCGHCSARVIAALSAVPGVKKATVNLDKKIAEITETSKGAADREAMRSAVDGLGFKVIDIK